jgi:uncharacterized radical SAM superfamily protein
MENNPKARSFFYPSFKKIVSPPRQVSGSCGTAAVSITGTFCGLNCEHCGGIILKNMQATPTPKTLKEAARRLAERGGKTLLISGGADHRGSVPLRPFTRTIKEIRSELGLKVLVHTGLVAPELADALAEARVDLAMLDIIGDHETIRKIYHLEAVVEDYERSLRNLSERSIPTAPHVIMGLHFGRIRGEEEALKMIARYPIKTLVLVGFRPIPGTAMAKTAPPPPEDMGRIFVRARTLFPKIPVVLGCERPLGLHRRKTDQLAIEAGLDGIAYPSDQAVALAEEKGKDLEFLNECCALISKR